MDRHSDDQNLNADPVAEAAVFAGYLVEAEMARSGRGTALDAARAIASRHKLPPALVRALIQPSRRPKDIGQRWWMRLRAAYLDYLRRQRVALDLEITRVEALGADLDTIRDLAAQTADLARRIEALHKD